MKEVLLMSGYHWDEKLSKMINKEIRGNRKPSFIGYLDDNFNNNDSFGSSALVRNHLTKA